jgi:hypothetical protein
MTASARELLEGERPISRIIVITGSKAPDSPLAKGMPEPE